MCDILPAGALLDSSRRCSTSPGSSRQQTLTFEPIAAGGDRRRVARLRAPARSRSHRFPHRGRRADRRFRRRSRASSRSPAQPVVERVKFTPRGGRVTLRCLDRRRSPARRRARYRLACRARSSPASADPSSAPTTPIRASRRGPARRCFDQVASSALHGGGLRIRSKEGKGTTVSIACLYGKRRRFPRRSGRRRRRPAGDAGA